MRTDLSIAGIGRLKNLDYRKVIIIAFLARLIFASAYDIVVSSTGRDLLLPDSKFYSMNGRYIASLYNGYRPGSFQKNVALPDRESRIIFEDIVDRQRGGLPAVDSETNIYFYIIGFIYFIFGHFPLGVRIFNILLGIASIYFIFKIAKRQFGGLTANIFLLIALYLPTQFGYSITLSKDFIRVFAVSFVLWVIYG